MYGASSTIALAHPFHLCVGQMKWNQKADVWEVSIRLHPQDLESTLTAELLKDQPTKKASVEDPDFPGLAQNYIQDNFFIRRTPLATKLSELNAILKSEGNIDLTHSKAIEPYVDRSTLKWVGMEQERGWLWIHLELQQPAMVKGQHQLWFVNRLLLDQVDRQENTLSIDPTIGPKYALQFKKGEAVREMVPVKSTSAK